MFCAINVYQSFGDVLSSLRKNFAAMYFQVTVLVATLHYVNDFMQRFLFHSFQLLACMSARGMLMIPHAKNFFLCFFLKFASFKVPWVKKSKVQNNFLTITFFWLASYLHCFVNPDLGVKIEVFK